MSDNKAVVRDLVPGKQRERAGVIRMPVGFGLAEAARMEVTAAERAPNWCTFGGGGKIGQACSRRACAARAPFDVLNITWKRRARARAARTRREQAAVPSEPPYSPKTLQANKKEQARMLFADSRSQILTPPAQAADITGLLSYLRPFGIVPLAPSPLRFLPPFLC